MDASELNRLNHPGFDRDPSGSYYEPQRRRAATERSEEQVRAGPKQETDEVILHPPSQTALALLRERVLQATRTALGVETGRAGPRFARTEVRDPEVVLGRLLSEQNLLAAQRRGRWSIARVDAALEEGMVQGTAETLDLLAELGELDGDSWRTVCAVLASFQRKLSELAVASTNPR